MIMSCIFKVDAGCSAGKRYQAGNSHWTRCATEKKCRWSCNQYTCRARGRVRYGINGRYNYRYSYGSIRCQNSVFGDPYRGRLKYCDYERTSSPTCHECPAGKTSPGGTSGCIHCPSGYVPFL